MSLTVLQLLKAMSVAPSAQNNRFISTGIGYAAFFSRLHHAVIRAYDEAGNVMEKARVDKENRRDLRLTALKAPTQAQGWPLLQMRPA
jgi:hypothetical protein